jgi:glyoxylase-like metal-dependent hydrolase (beta-lactamase superfamily II)
MISAGDAEFTVTHTPGHTPGSMVIHGELDGSKLLFAGDVDRPGKGRSFDISAWRKSVNKLLELSADKIYAGHEIVETKPQRWLMSLLKREHRRGYNL